MKKRIRPLLILCWLINLLCLPVTVNAEQTDNLPKIAFQVTTEKSVLTDRIKVVLHTQIQDSSLSKKHTQDLERRITMVMQQLMEYKGIQVVDNRRNSYANYNDQGKVVGWVSEATLGLESSDFTQVTDFIAKLPEHVQISDAYFFVSAELRKQQEDEMLKALFSQIQYKATLFKNELNREKYQIVSIDLSNDGVAYVASARASPMRLAKMDMEQKSNEHLGFSPSETRLTMSANVVILLSAN